MAIIRRRVAIGAKTNPRRLNHKRFTIRISTESIRINKEAYRWVYPLLSNLWCKCILSAENGDFLFKILSVNALKVSVKG